MTKSRLNLRKVIAIAICFAGILVFLGCEKEPVTYRFINEDKPKLLSHYVEGNILTFVNEIDEERQFKVEKIEYVTQSQYWLQGGCGGNCREIFYCEPKNIYFIDLTTQNTFYLSLARFPIDYHKARDNYYRLQPSSIFGQFCTTGWLHPYYFWISFNFEEKVNTFQFNGITYNDVIVATPTDGANTNGGGMLTDAKIIYYDKYQGLVGFDDVNNQQWRLK